MHIHFVCTGNVYRSRLAEAYLRSKNLPTLKVSSSGTEATDNTCGPICWYAQRIIETKRLVPYMSCYWTQTTAELIEAADIVIFMEQDEAGFVRQHLHVEPRNSRIWGIPDLAELDSLDMAETIRLAQAAEAGYANIMRKVDALIIELQRAPA